MLWNRADFGAETVTIPTVASVSFRLFEIQLRDLLGDYAVRLQTEASVGPLMAVLFERAVHL